MKAKLYGNYHFRKEEQDPVVDYLRAAREKRPVKTSEIAKQGLASSTISNLFEGKTRSPRFSTIMVIARCIGPEGVEAVAKCARFGGRHMRVVPSSKKDTKRNA